MSTSHSPDRTPTVGRVVAGPNRGQAAMDKDTADGIAWLLDDMIKIPGLNARIGLDAIIGLVPGIGDVAGTVLGSTVLVSSVRHRVPMRILLIMAWNLLFDQLLGLIPFIGDAADAVHRAHSKNYRLLRRTVERGETVDTDTRGYFLRAGLMVLVIILAMIAMTALSLWILWQVLSTVFGF